LDFTFDLTPMKNITPFLWFDDQAEQAAKFYTSIFNNSKLGTVTRYTGGAAERTGRPSGSAMTVEFELQGQPFVGLNGGPMFKFTEAISFAVQCETQQEVDYYWEKLLQGGGKESQCGWLKDRYGLSWQVVPTEVIEMMKDKDPAKAARVMDAIMGMTKLDIATLKRAYAK